MADYLSQFGDLPSKLASSKRVLIALSKDISVDSLASSLALALALQKNGKNVAVVSEGTPLVSHSHLFGIGDVKNTVPSSGEGNYVIKLDGVVDPSGQMNTVPALEKLDWYPEGSALNLVFHVVPGQRFEPTNVSYSHETSGFDLIFAIDADSLDELGQIYLKNASLFSKSTVVNIDNDPSNSQFGNVNIVDSQASSISEMMISILKGLSLELDGDIASNVVAGIYAATANLTQKVSPNTFSAVSEAMQAGGKLPEGGQSSTNPAPQEPVASEVPAQAPQVAPEPVVEAQTVVQAPEANQIQFNSQSTANNQQPTANPAPQAVAQEPVPTPAQPEPVTAPAPVQPEPIVQPQPATAPVQDAAPAPANDLYSNPFLNPGGSFGAPAAPAPVQAQPQPVAPAPSAPAADPFAAPASGPTFNFGSFGDASQTSVDSSQSTVGQAPIAPQQPVAAPAPIEPEKVDVSEALATIHNASQKDDAYDLKQIFNVEQMPETPVSANTTLDSAVQRVQATIDSQQPAAAQAIRDQQSAGQTKSTPSAAQSQPVQDSKPQASPEEKPAGEAVNSVNHEAEANPTPDWLVPKIFKGGSLG